MSLITESPTLLPRERVKLSHNDSEHYSLDGVRVYFELYSHEERKVFKRSSFHTSNGNSVRLGFHEIRIGDEIHQETGNMKGSFQRRISVISRRQEHQ